MERTDQLFIKKGIKNRFDLVDCGDEITKNKPKHSFLYTAKKLNCNPY